MNDHLTLDKPSPTAGGVAVALALWTLHAVILAVVISATAGIPLQYMLIGQGVSSAVLAACSLPAWWLIIREMVEHDWGGKLLAHAAVGPLYAWVSLRTAEIIIGWTAGPSAADAFGQNVVWIFISNLTVYVVQMGIYHTLQTRRAEQQRREQVREMKNLAERQELSALRAQMNPHFLFNALNSISAKVNRSPAEAREMIVMLSNMMRYALHSSDREVTSLYEELRFAQNYLALEKKRFVGRIQAEYDIPRNTLDASMPVIILQPLVENAVQHGLGSLDVPGTVEITAAVRGEQLHVSVADTGLGTAVSQDELLERGTGLSNTNNRLVRRFGPDAGLAIDTEPGKGFRVAFSIPYTLSPPAALRNGRDEELPFLQES
ncbi:MAG: sensor histidine kinase [Spirochaetes bacterium]|jgi:signal transduction histidine kinase|nr:sensor histidine kinase [Spirochaetota bacterium]